MLIDEVDHVDVLQVVVSPKKHVFMAMEYMDHDFRALMESMKVRELKIICMYACTCVHVCVCVCVCVLQSLAQGLVIPAYLEVLWTRMKPGS